MAKSNKADMSCARVKKYTASDVSKAERHNERKNETYENMNVIEERIPYNVHFKKPFAPTYMEQLKHMETDGLVSLRGLRKDATLFNEIVIDVNTMYFERNGGYEYAKQFYEEAFHFIEEKFGADNVISAVMHADEINVAATEELGKEVYHYHLHVMVLPVVEKEILWSKRCKDEKLRGTVKEVVHQISHSKKWKSDIPLTDEKGKPLLRKNGKPMFRASYSILQDELFNYMTEQGFKGLQRGEYGSTAEHLTSLQYQIKQDKERLEKLQKRIQREQIKYEPARNVSKTYNEIDSMGQKTITGKMAISKEDYSQLTALAKEGICRIEEGGTEMIKTLKNLFKQDKERFLIPNGVQDVIPIRKIYDDGVFQVGDDKFSKTYKFTDINYAVASREDKETMFLEYSELLNSFDSGATTKITINNRRLNRVDFEKNILIPLTGDALDEYRKEYNSMLLEKAIDANAITQEKYITISVNKKSVEEARSYFARVGAELITHFDRLGSKCIELEPDERLRIFHDFYRTGEETDFHFDIKETRKKGHDFKDFICPDSMEIERDYFKIGERYGRVLFLKEYASYIKDSMVAELTDLNRNLMMSIDVVPVPTDEAVREAENRLLGVETNATNWQRRQNANNNFSAQLPYDIEQQRKEMKEFLDDLTTRDQRMMFTVLTMVHTADTKEQLDNDTNA